MTEPRHEMPDADDMNAPDLEDIVAALQREFDDAEDFYGQVLQPEQEAANKYYDAEPFGDEIDGKSQIVLPDVAEAIDYMSASILRVFLSGDKVIEIEATEAEDEEGAQEATAALHYNFMREQDGARILGDWLQSGLLERIGIIKTVCETEEKVSRAKYTVDAEQAAALDMGLLPIDGEIEDITDNGDGTFGVSVKTTKVVKRYTDVPIPLNEFRFARNSRHEDSSDYLDHLCLKTRSELVEMGFDRAQVDELPIASNLDGAIYAYMDWANWRDAADLPHELQTCLLHEEYARMDVDGDGIAERVKVHRVEDQILRLAETGEPSIETISEQPIVVWSPLPRAHRLVGNSLADKVMDIQRIRSVIARQMQDAMYLANMPRPLVDMSNGEYASTTIEDLLRPIAGSPIRYKGQPPMPFQAGLDVSKSLTVLEHWNGERETRTGITRLNQGLDADTLNKTATGAALMQAQGQQMEEAIARQFGEAFGRLMAKKLRLMRAEGAKFPVKIDGQYTEADASKWPEDFRLIIRVGLGTGRKEQRLQYLFALGNLMQQGFEAGVVDRGGLFRYGSEVVSAMQLGQGDDYFLNPAEQPEEQEQPDPETIKAQAKMQGEQMKAQVKAQGDQMNAQSKAQAAQMTAMFKLQGDRERMAQEAELRREELDREERLRLIEIATDADAKANLPDASPGGDLSR